MMSQESASSVSLRSEEHVARAAAWSQYWATGALHSCTSSFADNYDGEVGAFWGRVFQLLPHNSRVADICCGNAPLSKLLLDSDYRLHVARIDAVDLADIAPMWALQSERLNRQLYIHANTSASDLPFDSGAIHLCMSQFGMEYVGRPAFIEAARVLKEDGIFAAVIHHSESLSVRIAREECGHIHWILNEMDVTSTVAPMIEFMSLTTTSAGIASLQANPAANKARVGLNDLLRALGERIEAAHFPDVLAGLRQAIMRVMSDSPKLGAKLAREKWHRVLTDLETMRLRQAELVEFACTEEQVTQWITLFGRTQTSIEPLHFSNGELAGWGVVAQRLG